MRSGISSAKIDSRALSVIEKLNAAGFDAYLVGGCVRDLLLVKTPSDLIAAGFNEGERIGQVLSQLLNEVMEGATPNETDALLKRAKAIF
jgi:hypothetical protein